MAQVTMILGCSLLGGCASIAGLTVDAAYSAAFRARIESASGLSPDELQQLQTLRFYSTDKGLAYTSIGQVQGISCKATVWLWIPNLSELNGRTPQEAAMMQLKIKAVRAGGNAILSSACSHSESIDWANNCWESWTCVGEAIHAE